MFEVTCAFEKILSPWQFYFLSRYNYLQSSNHESVLSSCVWVLRDRLVGFVRVRGGRRRQNLKNQGVGPVSNQASSLESWDRRINNVVYMVDFLYIYHFFPYHVTTVLGSRTGGQGDPKPLQILEQQKEMRFQLTHNQGLRHLFLGAFWGLRT